MSVKYTTEKIHDLWETKPGFRIFCYVALTLALGVAVFGLGSRIGEFAYIFSH